jgi:hypothetical protein
MAFVRRKGKSFYLVHNVRRGGKVQQLHLARLGDRARITDEVVREACEPSILIWRTSSRRCSGFLKRPTWPGNCWYSCGSCNPRFKSNWTSLAADADDLAMRRNPGCGVRRPS